MTATTCLSVSPFSRAATAIPSAAEMELLACPQAQIVLAVILAERLVVPDNAFLDVSSVQSGLANYLVKCCAYSDKRIFIL